MWTNQDSVAHLGTGESGRGPMIDESETMPIAHQEASAPGESSIDRFHAVISAEAAARLPHRATINERNRSVADIAVLAGDPIFTSAQERSCSLNHRDSTMTCIAKLSLNETHRARGSFVERAVNENRIPPKGKHTSAPLHGRVIGRHVSKVRSAICSFKPCVTCRLERQKLIPTLFLSQRPAKRCQRLSPEV